MIKEPIRHWYTYILLQESKNKAKKLLQGVSVPGILMFGKKFLILPEVSHIFISAKCKTTAHYLFPYPNKKSFGKAKTSVRKEKLY